MSEKLYLAVVKVKSTGKWLEPLVTMDLHDQATVLSVAKAHYPERDYEVKVLEVTV